MVAVNDVFQMDESETGVRKLKTDNVGFVVAGSVMTILFLIVINLITSFQHLWFIYPAFALLLSLFGILFIQNKKMNSILDSKQYVNYDLSFCPKLFIHTALSMVFIHAGSISAVANFHVARKTCQNNVDCCNRKYVDYSLLCSIKFITITRVSVVNLSDFCCTMVAAFPLSCKEKKPILNSLCMPVYY